MIEEKIRPVEYKLPPFRPLLILFLVAALLPLYLIASNLAQETLEVEASQHLTRIYNGLDTTLSKHAYLPALLAEQHTVIDFLSNRAKGEETDPTEVNHYLEKANLIADTSDIYLMQTDGLTVASSNWNLEQTFIGKNFSFRPYFQEAIQGKLGRYYALGTTSKARGYYFSRPVYADNKTIGVVTTKIAIGNFEQTWPEEEFEFIVSDPDGIIFLSSNREWHLKSITPLPEEKLQKLLDNRRYGNQPITSLDVKRQTDTASNIERWTAGREAYLVQSRKMNTAGWTISVLAPTNILTRTAFLVTAIGFVVLLLLGLLAGAWWQRQQERRHFEIRAREELETKVEQRTRELRKAQENLVQAAKMAALGELSAGINHELNNPLTAIRTYAENASQFLQQGNTQTVASNLAEITSLTERMAAITHQLKSFSRKSDGEIVCIDLNTAVRDALSIVQPRLSRIGKDIVSWNPPAETPFVAADLLWVEQILVNLLTNAIEAIQNEPQPLIRIEICSDNDNQNNDIICLAVSDNGPGIDEEAMTNLFEPFFTTKSVGKGLGLGLSISYRLARQMGGLLEAQNTPGGGALFILKLPTAGKPE